MKIVVDEVIPFGREVFQTLGEVHTAPGRDITPEMVKDAELLIIRTVTKANRNLLEGSRVRFVGTVTIGTDHLDQAFLHERGISYASAPGCNANSVAEYVTAGLCRAAQRLNWTLQGKSIAVIGGNVGSRVVEKTQALGLEVLCNDPPKARATRDSRYLPLQDVLGADIVSLHVPLNREGKDATWHLADQDFFRRMKKGALFINTARGKVMDSAALAEALGTGHLSGAIVDVWETEPKIDPELAKQVLIATAHIAGYSFDGRISGLRQIYEAACNILGFACSCDFDSLIPPLEHPEILLKDSSQDALFQAIQEAYDIGFDDAELRRLVALEPSRQAVEFDRLHLEYRRRREFSQYRILPLDSGNTLIPVFRKLGFQIAS